MEPAAKKSLWLLSGCGCLVVVYLIVAGVIVWRQLEDPEPDLRLAELPDVTGKPIHRPTFITAVGDTTAGTMFTAHDAGTGAVVLLSAHHLLGTAGGLERDLLWFELTDMVETIVAEPITASGRSIVVDEVLIVEGAEGMSWTSGVNDVLVCIDREATLAESLPLRPDAPAVGEIVWLYAETYDAYDALLHQARIIEAEAGFLEYRFLDPISIRATSGAPVIDARGRVVAINLGGYETDGAMIGLGNPIAGLADRIAKALAGGLEAP